MNNENTINHPMVLLCLAIIFAACSKGGSPAPAPQPQSDVNVFAVGNDSYSAQLWKNGKAVSLPSGKDANDIAISGENIFVSGIGYNNNDHYVAKYWKNEVAVDLTDGTRNAFANGIYVNGSDLYVSGREEVTTGGTYVATTGKTG
ncbi:MAG: hypothetical protein EOO68_27270 [Moraxellaceae bacterium]|nr:MAG: hypothetical protein EOO68_27270 [Moraxellaceae bacterium]